MDDLVTSSLHRMDWGFGNPNKTAALIATLLIVSWIFAHLFKKGFWLSLVLFTGLGCCLILTESRGGLVAAIIGCLAVLAWTPRPYPRVRAVAVVAACVAIMIFSVFIRQEPHLTKAALSPDRSIENRLLIWQQVPAMIRAAPGGWGLGKSGYAYMQWFQPIARGEGYRTLVSSHFTWLVELGWPGRILYLLFWTGCFVILWPAGNRRWFAIPLGIWLAFALCGFFSSVAESLVLWIVPVLALAAVLVVRFRDRTWPSVRAGVGAVAATGIAVSAILVWEVGTPPSNIHDQAGLVMIGAHAPRIWVVAPNESILGEHYGHEIRQAFNESPDLQKEGVGVTSSVVRIPRESILVFSGQIPAALTQIHPAEDIAVDPAPVPQYVLATLAGVPHVTILMGEYSRNREFWTDQCKRSSFALRLIPGDEEYIGTFMSDVSKSLKD